MAKKKSPINKTTPCGVEKKDGIQRSTISAQVLEVRDLATQGLSKSDCQSDPRQSPPLDLRAELSMAIGKLALGARDRMMGLAKLSRTGEFNGGQR